MNHVTHLLSSPDISIFSLEISNFFLYQKIHTRLHFTYIISNYSAKFNTPGLLKIIIFGNISHDVILIDYCVTNKTLVLHQQVLHQCSRRVKKKVRKFCDLSPTFVEIAGEELVGTAYLSPILDMVKIETSFKLQKCLSTL